MMIQGQRNDPATTKFSKPFLAQADDQTGGDTQVPSQKTCLVIEKSSLCKVFSKVPNQQEDMKGRSSDCYGILGIVNIQGHNFLVTISSRAFAAKLPAGINIYEV